MTSYIAYEYSTGDYHEIDCHNFDNSIYVTKGRITKVLLGESEHLLLEKINIFTDNGIELIEGDIIKNNDTYLVIAIHPSIEQTYGYNPIHGCNPVTNEVYSFTELFEFNQDCTLVGNIHSDTITDLVPNVKY